MLRNWWSALVDYTPRQTRIARPFARRRPLAVEALEDRCVLSTLSFVDNLGTAQYFSNAGNQTTTSITLTTTNDVEAGHSIIIELALDPRDQAAPVSVVDSVGNTYVTRADVTGFANGRNQPVRTVVLSAHGVTPLPAGGTITASFPANLAQSLTAQEFCGIDAFSPVDKVKTSFGDSSAPKSTGLTAFTSQADELLIGALGVEGNIDQDDPNGMNGFSPGANYTYLPGTGTPSGNSGNKNNSIHAEYRIVSATGAYLANGVLNTNANGKWAMAIVTFKADQATHLGLTAPATVSGGIPFSVTVSALDSANNVVPGYTGTIHFTVTNTVAGDVIPVDYTFTAADAGVHTFTDGFTLNLAGLHTITAFDECGNVSGSSVVDVKAPHFDISAPASVVAGSQFSLTVTAKNADDTTNTNYTGAVHFMTSDGGAGAVVPANYTYLAAESGVHTFTNQTILVTPGDQTIGVNDTVNTGIIGGAIITVTKAPTTTTIVSSLNPSTYGDNVTYTVTVTGVNSSVLGTPTGTVQFLIDGSNAGSPVNLSGGSASFSTALLSAGTHTISADYSGSSVYLTSTASLTQTVNSKTLTITAADKTKTYGQTVTFDTTTPSSDFTVSGLVTGDSVSSVSLASGGAAATAAVDSYAITPSNAAGSGLSNYTISYINGTLTVNAAALTITAANKSKTYGETVTFDESSPSSDFTVSGLLNSDSVSNVSLASGGAAATATVGSYPITPSNATGSGLSNYTISYVNGTLTVNAKALTITAANQSKTYGQTVTFDESSPSSDFTVSGLVNADTVTNVSLASSGAAATAAVGSYAITPSNATGSGLSNYSITYVNGTLTVNAASLTITAANKSKTYGDTVVFDQTTPSSDFSVGGLVNADSVTSITLTSSGAAATAAVGDYSIVPSAAVGTGLNNYSISYVNGTLTVNAKALTITAANKSKTYGDTVVFDQTTPSSDFTVSGLVNADSVTSITLTSSGAAATAPVGSYVIAPSAAVGTGLSNYEISYVNGTLSVNAKALTITAVDKSKTFGQTVTFDETSPSSDFTVSGLVNSDTVTNVSLASAGAPASAAVGSYPITPSNATGTGLSNYTISYVNGTLTVNAAGLTITAANKSKTYGETVTFDESVPSSDFTVSGLQGGDTVTNVTLTSSGAAATAAVGSYAITPSNATGSGLSNYSITYVNGTLTVNAKALTITAANQSKTYGDAFVFDQTTPSPDFSVSGLVNADTVTSITLTSSGAAATAAVGDYSIVPSAAVGTGLSNYSISYVNGTMTVNAKALTITAANQTKTYGAAFAFDQTTPSSDFSVSGLVNADTVTSITLTSSGAAATAAVGSYSIVPSAAVGTGLSNYSITYVNGTMTVNAKALTITAANKSKTYGETVVFDESTPSSDFSVSGLVNADTVTNVTMTSAGTAASAAVGSYAITPSNATGTGLSNYTISYVNGTLTVNAAGVTITAANKSKTYGQTVTFDESVPSSDFTVTGLQGSDSVTNVTLTSAGAEATAAVGSYAITPSNATGTGLSNYTISYVNGTLTVNAAALTITAVDKSKTYGQTVTFDESSPSSDFTVAGLVNTDTVTNVSLASSGAAASAAVGSYAITPSAATGTGLSNYTISYVNGTLTVNAATLTITAVNKSKVFGQTITFDESSPSSDFTVAGLVSSDTVTNVSLASAGAAASAAVGTYPITPSNATGTGLSNYSISYVNGTLTVDKANTTTVVTASVNPAVFGDPVTFTATVSPVAPGAGSPTGTVQFQVDGANLGSAVTVSGGVAQITSTTIAIGTHTITALYVNSDGNFNNSTGTLNNFVVNPKALSFRPIDGVDDQHRGVPCHTITFELIGPEEPPGVGPYTYQIDWDGNGTIDETFVNQPREIIITHEYETFGTYTPQAIVIDQTTGIVYSYTDYPDLIVDPPITILAAVIIDGNIVVGGGNGNDNIYVDATNPNNVIVKVGGVNQTNPAGGLWVVNPATGRIIVEGCGGADVIQLVGAVPGELHGGDGIDTITGGTGDDVIWGDAGDDVIQGGAGNDVMVGGAGRDRVYGDAGDDILIAGELASGNAHNGVEPYDFAVLRAICDAWAQGGIADADLSSPADDVIDGLDSLSADRLTGGSGEDWFIRRSNDLLVDFSAVAGDKDTTF